MKDAERAKAKDLFGSESEPTQLASKIIGIKSRTFDTAAPRGGGVAADKSMRVKLTETEKKRVEKMIREAKSMAEITRLEKDLNEGRIPTGAADTDRMET